MKILFVVPSYYPHVGGVEYVVKSVAERLTKRGHGLVVLAGEPGAERPRMEEINGVEVWRWPTWAPGGAYHIPKRRGELKQFLTDVARDVDIIHIHSVHAVLSIYTGLHLIKTKKWRVVVTPYYHGTGHTPVRRVLWKGWRTYVKKILTDADAIHTVSRLEARLIKEHFGLDAIPIENGVEEWILNVVWRPAGYVMYSGRVERYKNIHRLARIVSLLNKQGHDLYLKIYGKGPYREQLIKNLKALDVKFEMGDFLPFEEYIKSLAAATLFGLLSEKESYPQSINEANAVGVPVMVAKPWGENFSDRTRTLIVDLAKSDEEIAKETAQFLHEAPKQPRPKVPTWDEVVEKYMNWLYSI